MRRYHKRTVQQPLKGRIAKLQTADSTLNNMKKQQLIELLHIAEHNHSVLADAYDYAKNAITSIAAWCGVGEESVRTISAEEYKAKAGK